ncbi:hypothetical protein B0T22DRAFT_10943 [Podospora appendiculata]|uniref:Uncharacterized protein n=1 Tax=Podospora appendiculata TaxID=314037 RepID=A0AAE0XFY2_9PEZI|nr:hypothetical protein B0T22DRAFT_10943 [Podospora appendiculata]
MHYCHTQHNMFPSLLDCAIGRSADLPAAWRCGRRRGVRQEMEADQRVHGQPRQESVCATRACVRACAVDLMCPGPALVPEDSARSEGHGARGLRVFPRSRAQGHSSRSRKREGGGETPRQLGRIRPDMDGRARHHARPRPGSRRPQRRSLIGSSGRRRTTHTRTHTCTRTHAHAHTQWTKQQDPVFRRASVSVCLLAAGRRVVSLVAGGEQQSDKQGLVLRRRRRRRC